MPERVLRKLGMVGTLTKDDRDALIEAFDAGRAVTPGTDLSTEGEPDAATHVLLSGWACQYKQLDDGRRQILGFLLPGDIANLCSGMLPTCDHSVATLTHGRVARIDHGSLRRLAGSSPGIGEALAMLWLLANAMQQERIVSLGRRTAPERLGHLLCELYARLELVGLAHGGTCEMPLRQCDLADALGISVMHVNRTVHAMRDDGLFSLGKRRLAIPDLAALQKASGFDASYLQPSLHPRSAAQEKAWLPSLASRRSGPDGLAAMRPR